MDVINKAFSYTQENHLDYLNKNLETRLEGSSNGSYYQVESAEVLLNNLLKANWVEFYPVASVEGCRYFKSDLEGVNGLSNLSSLPDELLVKLSDPKNTGKLSVCTSGIVENKIESESTLILGPDEKELMVYTFHPGMPITPSSLKVEGRYKDGYVISVKEAKLLGFDFAKNVDDFELNQLNISFLEDSIENLEAFIPVVSEEDFELLENNDVSSKEFKNAKFKIEQFESLLHNVANSIEVLFLNGNGKKVPKFDYRQKLRNIVQSIENKVPHLHEVFVDENEGVKKKKLAKDVDKIKDFTNKQKKDKAMSLDLVLENKK